MAAIKNLLRPWVSKPDLVLFLGLYHPTPPTYFYNYSLFYKFHNIEFKLLIFIKKSGVCFSYSDQSLLSGIFASQFR